MTLPDMSQREANNNSGIVPRDGRLDIGHRKTRFGTSGQTWTSIGRRMGFCRHARLLAGPSHVDGVVQSGMGTGDGWLRAHPAAVAYVGARDIRRSSVEQTPGKADADMLRRPGRRSVVFRLRIRPAFVKAIIPVTAEPMIRIFTARVDMTDDTKRAKAA